MKSIPRLIRRFISIFLISSFLILILNTAFLMILSSEQTPSISPYATADEIAESLQKTDNGYRLDRQALKTLSDEKAWAIFVEEKTHKVVWKSDNTPKEIPSEYTLAEISDITLGYVKDYPTYIGSNADGIVILAYPKDRFWKSMTPTWDYDFIANSPKTAIMWLAINIILILLIYITASSRLLKSTRPISDGIQNLPTKKPVHLKEKGLFAEIAKNINQTSDILQIQQYELQKKETARANWIAGVSHDIRTPLSMVMGYAGQLAQSDRLEKNEKEKAMVIVNQSEKIKNLISDLNLVSKLEYNIQPAFRKENAVSVLRQTAVEFINNDIDNKYPVAWLVPEDFTVCTIRADSALLSRAISNLIQNCINHNENGCRIYLNIKKGHRHCTITVDDDGTGATDEQLEKLNNTPHYMMCDKNIAEPRHGLGLLIVKQIAAAHNGKIVIQHSTYGGLCAEIILPTEQE